MAQKRTAPTPTNVLVTLFLVVLMVVMGVAAAAPASPARAASRSPAVLAAVSETAKVTLPETSIAGPGFTGAHIAWTGTDATHHVNFNTETDGLHFPTKVTLPETSPDSPAIVQVIDHGPSGPVVLAWTGTDANDSLNVQIIPGGRKLTLHETSIAAPAIDFISTPGQTPNTVLLAWTGTDANDSLNVLPITTSNPLIPGTKTVLSQFSSNAGPSLKGNVFFDRLVLGWSTRGAQQLNLAESTDAVHFTSALGSGLPQTSATAPQFFNSSNPCIAWTGTDAVHHLNVQCTTQFPQFPNPAQTKTVLPETALGAPGFSMFSQAEIAWTGTDAAHHLNVATLQGV